MVELQVLILATRVRYFPPLPYRRIEMIKSNNGAIPGYWYPGLPNRKRGRAAKSAITAEKFALMEAAYVWGKTRNVEDTPEVATSDTPGWILALAGFLIAMALLSLFK